MTAIKTRLEKLEAQRPIQIEAVCLVVHHKDCSVDRSKAVAAFVEMHGKEPTEDQIVNVLLISPEEKRPVCGCSAASLN